MTKKKRLFLRDERAGKGEKRGAGKERGLKKGRGEGDE